MVYLRGLRRSPVGRYWTRKTLRPAGVTLRPKPLRSVSHQITSWVEAGRAPMPVLESLQLGTTATWSGLFGSHIGSRKFPRWGRTRNIGISHPSEQKEVFHSQERRGTPVFAEPTNS